ncbi:probable adenylosuccinate lyase [Thermoplasma acidophilum]|uniref:Adenylosuccinate lyase n=1 Tax=Thermoplasma acidophilum (strain ATCC 25905 / DSM 1728 / JCM 9062 / NBRC 15155 / AMRC-C165) TaxID=273075 RepID=Q9HKS3_THEAC|nr:adenylosuccinate lyase [Thermoplasma acidophilum]MCY0852381.1 adenylosuccinate lyase [Thermoplasma acidophilum]CAC11663.1 probable adenylosuccinate lyase [Thermoplasma acidophilum]
MVVSPIEYRYGRRQVKKIFDDETRLNYMLKVEAAIAKAESELGIIPQDAYNEIQRAVDSGSITLDEVRQVEDEIKHDVMAVVRVLSKYSGSGSKYVHFGVTSNDINDTATALQLHDFSSIYRSNLVSFMETLVGLASKYRDLPMMGRTHGQHASPITLGLKFAVYLAEMIRHLDRWDEMAGRAFAGKVLGPVGTGAALGEMALDVQKRVMDILGIYPEDGATQIVNRDRYIEYLSVINGISVTLEKIATEIRNLQRPEIDELSEYFDFEKQVGSSSMPSKVNPINSENVVSLSRFIRSLIISEYEAGVTWHERDLTNSASERFVIPYASILIDYATDRLNGVLKTLIVKEDNIRRNLENDDSIYSESIVTILTERGMARQDAHEFVRRSAMNARSKGMSFRQGLLENGIERYLSKADLDRAMDPANFIGLAPIICDTIVKKAKERIGMKDGEQAS